MVSAARKCSGLFNHPHFSCRSNMCATPSESHTFLFQKSIGLLLLLYKIFSGTNVFSFTKSVTSTISQILPLLLTHARVSTSLPRLRAITSCHNIIASPQLSFFCVWVNHNFHSTQHLHGPQHSTPLAARSPSSFPTTTHCTPHPCFKPRSPHTHLCIPALYFLALP